MNPLKFEIVGEQRFVAVVMAGHAAAATKVWVCVARPQPVAGSGWSGCWSSDDGQVKDAAALRGLLEDLSAQVRRVGRVGPFGAYLDDHLFFEGWETWGSGIPAPLAGLAPLDVVTNARECVSPEEAASKYFDSAN